MAGSRARGMGHLPTDGATVIPPPQGPPMMPDVANWSWHEYGMRVGFWRLHRMFQRLGISPTVTINAQVCQSIPRWCGLPRQPAGS